MSTVYIYSTDKYGNPGPYFTTAKLLLDDLRQVGYTDELDERDGLYDSDGEQVAEVADAETIECYYQIDDPHSLMS